MDPGTLLVCHGLLHPRGAGCVLNSQRRLLVRAPAFPRSTLSQRVPSCPPSSTSTYWCFRSTPASTSASARSYVRRSFRWTFASPPASGFDSHAGLNLGLVPDQIPSRARALVDPRPGLAHHWLGRWGEVSCTSRRVGRGGKQAGGSTWREPRSAPSSWMWNSARRTL